MHGRPRAAAWHHVASVPAQKQEKAQQELQAARSAAAAAVGEVATMAAELRHLHADLAAKKVLCLAAGTCAGELAGMHTSLSLLDAMFWCAAYIAKPISSRWSLYVPRHDEHGSCM